LIAQHQIVDIDSRVRALPYVSKFNPNVLVTGRILTARSGSALFGVRHVADYNRTLFTQAGLDPTSHPRRGRSQDRRQDHRTKTGVALRHMASGTAVAGS